MQEYGIGIAIRNFYLSAPDDFSSLGLSDPCDRSYVEIRETDHRGRILKRLCPQDSDESGFEVFRILLDDVQAVYIESRGGSSADAYTIDYTAVSLVCPGVAGPNGIPETEEELCDGRGTCVLADYSVSERISPSKFECACRLPYAASFLGGSCDTCGFGFNKQDFPSCASSTSCARNCSGNGVCLPTGYCQCFSGYYGLDCTIFDDDERLGSLEPDLVTRVPLNGEDAGNVIQSGDVDRTMIDCSMSGAVIPCRSEARSRGRNFAREENSIYDSTRFAAGNGFGLRRQQQDGAYSAEDDANSSSSAASSSKNDTGVIDEGISLNLLATQDTYPQFIRTENTTDGVAGTLTIVGWVKVTAITQGFLFAKTDSAFYSDGRTPVLEKAKIDVQDRNTPLSKMRLWTEELNLHVAVYMNGPKKRVDLLVSRPWMKNSTTNKEEWLYVRHFRLGEKTAGELFDGSWRYVALKLYQSENRVEGQIYVDGFTKIADPDFTQCLPWLPPLVSEANQDQGVNSSDLNVVVQYPGTSLWWGYRMRGVVDELHVYSKALSQRTIITVGGEEFLDQLFISTEALLLLIALSGTCVVVSILVLGKRLHPEGASGKANSLESEEAAAADAPAGSDCDEKHPTANSSKNPMDLDAPQEEDHVDGQEVSPQAVAMGRSQMLRSFLRGEESNHRRRSTGRSLLKRNDSTVLEIPESDIQAAALQADQADVVVDENDLDIDFDEDDFKEIVLGSSFKKKDSLGEGRIPVADDGEDLEGEQASQQHDECSDEGNKRSFSSGSELADEEDDDEGVVEFDNIEEAHELVQEALEGMREDLAKDREKYVASLNASAIMNGSEAASPLTPSKPTALTVSNLESEDESTDVAPGVLTAAPTATATTIDLDVIRKKAKQTNIRLRRLDAIKKLHDETVKIQKVKEKNEQETRNKAVKLLNDTYELAQTEVMKNRRMKAAGGGAKSLSALATSVSMSCTEGPDGNGSEVPLIVRPFVETFQILAQLAGALAFPQEWKDAFGRFALFVSCDLLQAFNLPFEPMFYAANCLSLVLFLILIIVELRTKALRQKDVLKSLKRQYIDRKRALSNGTKYKAKGQVKEKLILVCALGLAFLYMPVTQLSLQAVFCHRSLQCTYDCYADQAHKNLVGVGVLSLVGITLGVPLFFIRIVRRILVQYQYYLGAFDQELQSSEWPKFINVVRSPFTSLYERYTFDYAYFEVAVMAFKAAMSGFSIAMTPETLPQLVCIMAIQGGFTLLVVFLRPMVAAVGNRMIIGVHLFLISLLLIQTLQLLFPDSQMFGLLMVLLTVLVITYVVINLGLAVRPPKEDENDVENEEEESEKQEVDGCGQPPVETKDLPDEENPTSVNFDIESEDEALREAELTSLKDDVEQDGRL